MGRVLGYLFGVALFTSPPIAQAARERAAYAPPPQYPADAKAHHLTGSGAFALHVLPDGTVKRVETLKSIGHPSLDRAAIAAFERWRFHPSPEPWILRIPIRYVDGPKRPDPSMSRAPSPGWGILITVFSGHD
jgi:TonB family protein